MGEGNPETGKRNIQVQRLTFNLQRGHCEEWRGGRGRRGNLGSTRERPFDTGTLGRGDAEKDHGGHSGHDVS